MAAVAARARRRPRPFSAQKGIFCGREREGGREEGGLGLCDAQKMVGPLSFGYTNIAWIRPEPGGWTVPLKRVRGIGEGNLMSAISWDILSVESFDYVEPADMRTRMITRDTRFEQRRIPSHYFLPRSHKIWSGWERECRI